MSRIGKMPVEVPKGVDINVDGRVIRVKGPKGALTVDLLPGVDAAAPTSLKLSSGPSSVKAPSSSSPTSPRGAAP